TPASPRRVSSLGRRVPRWASEEMPTAARDSGGDGGRADVGQAQVVAQGGAGVVGAQGAAVLQERDHVVDEFVQAGGDQVGAENEAVGTVLLDEGVDLL